MVTRVTVTVFVYFCRIPDEQLMKYPAVHYGQRGEGEITIRERYPECFCAYGVMMVLTTALMSVSVIYPSPSMSASSILNFSDS